MSRCRRGGCRHQAKEHLEHVVPSVVATLLAAALGACGGGSSAATDTVPPTSTTVATTTTTSAPEPEVDLASLDLCALVTKAEAEAIVGTELQEPRRGGQTPASCTYGGPPAGPLAQVEIYGGDPAESVLDINRGLGHEFTPIEDLADEAYSSRHAVYFRHGTLWVSIHVARLVDPSVTRGPLEDAARLAASRL
jgi:hypothetical protein